MYAVVEGAVGIIRNGEVIESLVGDDIFGALARVDQEHFTFLVHEHPTFALTVMAVLADRLRRANDRA
jgi:signal-transduction protein with cAMP-binding, CBS, and nucleotidyltransferase domain